MQSIAKCLCQFSLAELDSHTKLTSELSQREIVYFMVEKKIIWTFWPTTKLMKTIFCMYSFRKEISIELPKKKELAEKEKITSHNRFPFKFKFSVN